MTYLEYVSVGTYGSFEIYFGRVYLGRLYREVDGYYVWWDDREPNGGAAWESPTLRDIADKLDELNKPVDKDIIRYFTIQKVVDEIDISDETLCEICGDSVRSSNHRIGCNIF